MAFDVLANRSRESAIFHADRTVNRSVSTIPVVTEIADVVSLLAMPHKFKILADITTDETGAVGIYDSLGVLAQGKDVLGVTPSAGTIVAGTTYQGSDLFVGQVTTAAELTDIVITSLIYTSDTDAGILTTEGTQFSNLKGAWWPIAASVV